MEWVAGIIQHLHFLGEYLPLWHDLQTVQFHCHNVTGLVDQLWILWILLASTCCSSMQQHRVWHCPQQSRRPSWASSNRCWKTSASLEDTDDSGPSCTVQWCFNPVQFIVHVCFEVFIVSHYAHINPLDWNRGHWFSEHPNVQNPFLYLCHIKLQMILLPPLDEEYAISSPSVMHLSTTESSENLWRGQVSVQQLKSVV